MERFRAYEREVNDGLTCLRNKVRYVLGQATLAGDPLEKELRELESALRNRSREVRDAIAGFRVAGSVDRDRERDRDTDRGSDRGTGLTETAADQDILKRNRELQDELMARNATVFNMEMTLARVMRENDQLKNRCGRLSCLYMTVCASRRCRVRAFSLRGGLLTRGMMIISYILYFGSFALLRRAIL